MNEPAPETPAAPSAVACGPGCRFAEPLRNQPDWLWCNHPQAAVRVRSTSRECAWFAPASPGRHTAPASLH